jgi:hypothetical protein
MTVCEEKPGFTFAVRRAWLCRAIRLTRDGPVPSSSVTTSRRATVPFAAGTRAWERAAAVEGVDDEPDVLL